MLEPTTAGNRAELMGDRAARCFEDYHRDVFLYARRRTGDEWIAEDVTAEVFVVVIRRDAEIPTHALPWLYGIARRTIANQTRAGRRRDRLQAKLRSTFPRRSETESIEDRVASDEMVRAALRRLPEGDRELLMLIAWEGLSRREAAQALGCSDVALRARMTRARRRLRRAIGLTNVEAPHKPGEEAKR